MTAARCAASGQQLTDAFVQAIGDRPQGGVDAPCRECHHRVHVVGVIGQWRYNTHDVDGLPVRWFGGAS